MKMTQRGVSVSVFVTLLIPLLVVMVGLAVDSVRMTHCTRIAENTAAQAARAATDAAIVHRVVGDDGSQAAMVAAQRVLDESAVTGTVTNHSGYIEVTTSVTQPTVFLGIVGIDQISGKGHATAHTVER